MLEDNFQQTKGDLRNDMKIRNQLLYLERKERERREREERLEYEREEVNYLQERGAKQEFYMNVQ